MIRKFKFTLSFKMEKVVPMNGSYDALSCVYSVVETDITSVKFPSSATHVELQFGVLSVNFEASIYKMFMATSLFLKKVWK